MFKHVAIVSASALFRGVRSWSPSISQGGNVPGTFSRDDIGIGNVMQPSHVVCVRRWLTERAVPRGQREVLSAKASALSFYLYRT